MEREVEMKGFLYLDAFSFTVIFY